MRVKMRTSGAGPLGTWKAGDIVAFPEDSARYLLESGQGEAVGEEPVAVPVIEREAAVIETAAIEPAETQEFPARRRRRVNE